MKIEKILRKDFPRYLRYQRKAWDMSRGKLGYLTNIDKYDIEDFENGVYCDLNMERLIRIAEQLDIPLFSFFQKGTTIHEFELCNY